ncbi:hypothetical protein DL96DRAFT_348310 [Flagelloscypha sp. PMI_526]|nr:hypothetical protein DL96DRAFT_348310 [Flagelloscypha sp. PMI_526]
MLSPAAAKLFALSVDGTLAAVEMGAMFNVFMIGVVSLQTYYYFSRQRGDRVFLRLLIAAIWLFELAQSSSFFHTLYGVTVLSFGNPDTLARPPPSLVLTMGFGGLATALTQSFIAWRMYRLLALLPLTIFSWVLTLVRLMGTLTITITGWSMTSVPEYRHKLGWCFLAIVLVTVVNDIILAVGLFVPLYKSRRKIQNKNSVLMDQVILWVHETGLLTAALSLVVVICFFAEIHTYIWIAIYSVAPKLYSSSLLAILNGRRIHHQRMVSESSFFPSSLLRSSMAFADPGSQNVGTKRLGTGTAHVEAAELIGDDLERSTNDGSGRSGISEVPS